MTGVNLTTEWRFHLPFYLLCARNRTGRRPGSLYSGVILRHLDRPNKITEEKKFKPSVESSKLFLVEKYYKGVSDLWKRFTTPEKLRVNSRLLRSHEQCLLYC